jgi:hypothetical protein
MIGKREFETIAAVNAKAFKKIEAEYRNPEESTAAGGAILRLIASQVAAFQLLNPAFDSRRFVKASGVTEDWLQSRVLGWAAQE